MFRLIGTMKGLGFRGEKARYDIEFPTRNHLKVLLAKLISKRRKQHARGLIDLTEHNSTAIISTTDHCEEQLVSHRCKNMFGQRENEENLVTPKTGTAAGSHLGSPKKFNTNRGSSITSLNGRMQNFIGGPSNKKQDQ